MSSAALTIDREILDRGRSFPIARFRSFVLPAMLAMVFATSLSRSLFDPLGKDQAQYQFMAERVLAGERLYADVWDQNGPGIVIIHGLATVLFGDNPMALRLLDAIWQSLTLGAMVWLGGRDSGRWNVGWLAAALYCLAYYGFGFVETGQREGFTVLPLIVMAHAVIREPERNGRRASNVLLLALAGGLGLAVFMIKPPMGLCYGVLWLVVLRDDWRNRVQGPRAFLGVMTLSAGFLAAAALSVVVMLHLDWWTGFWETLTRKNVPQYILGPWMVREMIPRTVAGLLIIALGIAASLAFSGRTADADRTASAGMGEWLWLVLAATVLLLVQYVLRYWESWAALFMRVAGVWVPALGAFLLGPGRNRSRTWRVVWLLAGASLAALVLQGRSSPYRFPPLWAFAGYLAAGELSTRLGRLRAATPLERLWAACCIAAVAQTTVGHWGTTMTAQTWSPHVLAGTSLSQHYQRCTRNSTTCSYATAMAVAQRVRQLTRETDEIISLFDDPRLLCFAKRPIAHRLVRLHPAFRPLFEDCMKTIRQKRPVVVLAQVPAARRHDQDLAAVQSAIFEEIESFVGPSAQVIRRNYQLTEIIDHIGILQPGIASLPVGDRDE